MKLKNIIAYIQDTYNELVYKVTWPTWNELQNNTIAVVVASVIFALLIFVMDFIFGVNPKEYLWRGVLGLVYPS